MTIEKARGRPARERQRILWELEAVASAAYDRWAAHAIRCPRRRRCPLAFVAGGPYCVLAPQAVELLHAAGFRARRLMEGLPERQLAGLPVEAAATG